jgi:hypothetical protein
MRIWTGRHRDCSRLSSQTRSRGCPKANTRAKCSVTARADAQWSSEKRSSPPAVSATPRTSRARSTAAEHSWRHAERCTPVDVARATPDRGCEALAVAQVDAASTSDDHQAGIKSALNCGPRIFRGLFRLKNLNSTLTDTLYLLDVEVQPTSSSRWKSGFAGWYFLVSASAHVGATTNRTQYVPRRGSGDDVVR